jgi:hypothetical protein
VFNFVDNVQKPMTGRLPTQQLSEAIAQSTVDPTCEQNARSRADLGISSILKSVKNLFDRNHGSVFLVDGPPYDSICLRQSNPLAWQVTQITTLQQTPL